jgi:hypothetical protein
LPKGIVNFVGAYTGSIEAWYLDEESLKYGFRCEMVVLGLRTLLSLQYCDNEYTVTGQSKTSIFNYMFSNDSRG